MFRREGGIPDRVLHYFRSDSKHSFWQEDFPKDLALRRHYSRRAIPALHQRRFYHPAIRYYSVALRARLCGTHSRRRKVRPLHGQCATFGNTVSSGGVAFHFPDVFRGLERKFCGVWHGDRRLFAFQAVDSAFVRRHPFERCGVHIANCRAKQIKAHHSIAIDEP